MAGGDPHCRFCLVIPVADRPRQLDACLESLQALRRRFPNPRGRLELLLADDSADPASIAAHAALAHRHQAGGLAIEHWTPARQLALLQGLPPPQRALFGAIDPARPGHKGASTTRNLALLHLQRRYAGEPRRLLWFIDSDQLFRVNRPGPTGEEERYAIDYFAAWERLFADPRIEIATGKVVGDPPVSPAVMASTLLEDLLGLLQALQARAPDAPCGLHPPRAPSIGDAAYHDMADLFGFQAGKRAIPYRCPLHGPHDQRAALRHLSGRLDGFFDGEHPTRRSHYLPTQGLDMRPARTLYTGNFVLRASALRWFIPFAPLRLRMAGPTLGRILRSALGDGFVSVNLPMLHRRTQADARAECRPGIERRAASVDLSGEAQRQFAGDLMLFSVERLIALGWPQERLTAGEIGIEVEATTARITRRYGEQRQAIARACERLQGLLQGDDWWQRDREIRAALEAFSTNLRHNYLEPPPPRGERELIARIAAAIADYPAQQRDWGQLLRALAP